MILYFILFILWFAVFYPIYPEMVSNWLNHSNNSHGLLVPFLSVYFIWNSRDELNGIGKGTTNLGLVVLTCSLIIYLLSYVGGVAFIARMMIVSTLIGLVLYNFGKEVFRKLAFPLFFLLFMVPIPVSIISLISLPLQRLATDVAAFLIQLTSIPVYQEGNMLYFVQTQLEVAEACSGLRSMTSLLMLGTIFVYLSNFNKKRKAILLISTFPLAIFANIVRVSGTGILAHFFGSAVAKGFLHDFSGMAVFLFGLMLMWLEYKLLSRYRMVKSN
jgi:exosortase